MENLEFYTLSQSEKAEIYRTIANELGMTPFAVEKDWWVCLALRTIFQMDIADHLVFKGGTSLSKAWKLISRFSEDIDLAIDRAYFGFGGDISKNQRDKLRKIAGTYTSRIFFDELQKAFIRIGFSELKYKVIESKESDLDAYSGEIDPHSGKLTPNVFLVAWGGQRTLSKGSFLLS